MIEFLIPSRFSSHLYSSCYFQSPRYSSSYRVLQPHKSCVIRRLDSLEQLALQLVLLTSIVMANCVFPALLHQDRRCYWYYQHRGTWHTNDGGNCIKRCVLNRRLYLIGGPCDYTTAMKREQMELMSPCLHQTKHWVKQLRLS